MRANSLRQWLGRRVVIRIVRQFELIDHRNRNRFRFEDLKLTLKLGSVERRIRQNGLLLKILRLGICKQDLGLTGVGRRCHRAGR